MANYARHSIPPRILTAMALGAALAAPVTIVSCGGNPGTAAASDRSAVLRVGVAQLSANNPLQGLQQLGQLLSVEGLARPGENGRMDPWLAESWTTSSDGRMLTVHLRSNVKFHDGSAADAQTVSALLPAALRSLMGPVYDDVEYVRPSEAGSIEIGFRAPSPFLVESLEATIQRPGTTLVGTGPFAVVPNSTTEMHANTEYYLGNPSIDTIQVQAYPSIRMAWAEMLRNQLDMLWEVGPEALDSMKGSTTISEFTFTRRYQHAIVFNPGASALQSPAVRRALSYAVDRAALVKAALDGYGLPSSGPVWPRHWALPADPPQFNFDPKRAAEMLGGNLRRSRFQFTCLVAPDSIDERIALEVKRQLAAVGVDMIVEESSREEIQRRGAQHQFEAAVIEVVSGPTIFRPYLMWHSNSPRNWGHFGNKTIDAALDRVRHATSDDNYRTAALGLQDAFMTDPPAIFLAWSQRARAVSKRFLVPTPEQGREILSTLRLWKPAPSAPQASRN